MRMILLSGTLAALMVCTLAAEAQQRRQPRGAGYGVVMAESEHGHGSISGPVRTGPHGRLEVGLPGGTWVECGRSCRDTLRRETVDFWENHGTPQGGEGVGYLRFWF